MIFVAGAAFCQQAKPFIRPEFSLLKLKTPTTVRQYPPLPFNYLPANFYSSRLGFFCRQEIKMDKLTKIPFRFRLGSVEQCDWLEGKGKQKMQDFFIK
jgi:hypothetical protein